MDAGSKLNLRRRFLTGGGALISAPVVMSLASRSAFAEVCTPSAYASTLADVTRSGTRNESCSGLSPGGWKNPQCKARNAATQTWGKWSFSATFGGVWKGGNGSWNADKTFCEVLPLQGYDDRYQFGAHIVAAYLNASGLEAGVEYVMTQAQVADMGRQIVLNGRYVNPSAGINWDPQTVVSFIQMTFH
ncbi:hypothetical protein JCM17960_31400 [Magnetospira thiophila]